MPPKPKDRTPDDRPAARPVAVPGERPADAATPRPAGWVRPAGPEAMADPPDDWTEEDEASDESFPASDPPATY